MKKTLWIIGGLVAALIVVGGGVTAVLLLTGDDDDDTSRHDTADDDDERTDDEDADEGDYPAELADFYTQEIEWDDCGSGECATFEVPVDYEDPEGDTVEIAMRRVGNEKDHLFVNPGGPGGSAQDFAETMGFYFGDDVLDEYSVVGVDPRGVGESTPLECLDDEEFEAYVDVDPTPDDQAELDQMATELTKMATACEDNSGDLAGHVSTVEAARDMDIARALVGDDEFNWYGASYGTYLGATYASLFPENVGRMVLDGAINPELGSIDSAMGQTTGFQRALEAYIEDCVSDASCPLGTDPAAAQQAVVNLLAGIDAQPMATSDPDRPLTEGEAFFGVALPLYAEDYWPMLTDALRAALVDGDGTALQELSDMYFERSSNGTYANNSGQVITAINCLDSRDRPTIEEVQSHVDEFTAVSPVFGRALVLGAAACSMWPLESEEDEVDFSAEGAPPILVLGTTRDPATPYEQAVELADLLDSGVLVTRDGDGHTAYTSGNSCIAEVVDDFFVDGDVPEEDPEC